MWLWRLPLRRLRMWLERLRRLPVRRLPLRRLRMRLTTAPSEHAKRRNAATGRAKIMGGYALGAAATWVPHGKRPLRQAQNLIRGDTVKHMHVGGRRGGGCP